MKQHHEVGFYQKLGYLFYSVAAADGHIAEEEKEALHREVKEDWLKLETGDDGYGSNNAYQIEILFDYLIEKEFPGERAFQVFEHYFKSHYDEFSDEVIEHVFKTCDRIANAFHGKNKSELTALMRIHLLMNKKHHIL